MKVAVAHTQFDLYWPARLRALRDFLRDEGAELAVVEVASPRSEPDRNATRLLVEEGVEWSRLSDRTDPAELATSKVARGISHVFAQMQPDVVLAGAIAFTPGATAVRWCRSNRRGLVVMDDARHEDVPRSVVVNAIKRRVFANVDAMLIPAPSHLPTYQRFGFPSERIFFGVDAVDNDWFAASVERYRRAQSCMIAGIELAPPFFLGVGRQVPKKNWNLLLRAYASYRSQANGEAWNLLLVGDGPERAVLEETVRTQKIAGVRMLPNVTQEEVCSLYAAAKCLVLPSVYGETWGLVVNEAMASGLPVLVSRECGCAATLVRESQNGWTFSPHSEDDLSSRLSRLAAMPEPLRRRMGCRSREIIAEWSLARFVEGAWAAIRSCLNVRRGFASPMDRLILRLWKGRYRPS